MSIDSWMGKEIVVYICNGILLHHEKQMNVSQLNWGGWTKSLCYIEWSKSERKKEIYINAYMQNLENGINEHIFRVGIETKK